MSSIDEKKNNPAIEEELGTEEQQREERKKGSHYDATSIRVLGGIEAVRKRPAMYIGDTSDRGLHHLVEELVSNSVDEALGGYCQNIWIKLHADGSLSVIDDARGFPVDIHPEEGRPAIEVIMTKLHAGGKFDHKAYRLSAGLHGVGVTVVNALSEWMEVEVRRDGHVYRQTYERGQVKTPLEKLGVSKRSGSRVTFKPDREIFPETEFSFERITSRARELAYLNKGLTFHLSEEKTQREETYCYDGGIVAMVQHINEGKAPLHPEVIYVHKEHEGVDVEVAFQYNNGFTETVMTYANNINTHEGGTHLSGFRSALTRTINFYARKQNLIKDEKDTPGGEDIREGITAVLSIRVPDPQFEGQTKTTLGNREVAGIVETVINEELSIYLEEHPRIARDIVDKALLSFRAREAARKARDLARRKGAMSTAGLPVKLTDCTSHNREETEIYLVEGQSAGGNAKQCRDSRFQAILPLRGKLLNVEKARIDKMLSHAEIVTLIAALGTGIGTDEFNLERLRYGKVIIMTDADYDGLHIRTLLLTFFYRHMSKLVEGEHLYVARPPLYRVERKSRVQYFQTHAQLEDALTELGLDGTTFHVISSGKRFGGEEVKTLVALLTEMERLGNYVHRRGVPFETYLGLRRDDGALPSHRISVDGDVRYAFSQEQVNEIIREFEEVTGNELAVQDEAEGEPAQEVARLEVTEFHEQRELQRILGELESRAFTIKDYLGTPPEPGEDPVYPFQLGYEKRTVDVLCLADLPGAVRKLGEEGLEITRYKGLGEMNPGQLWETTMDPDKRTLLRVKIEDAVKADQLFSLLMGEMVEPRREFIESHALEATDLDLF